jgi:hypothetical protein
VLKEVITQGCDKLCSEISDHIGCPEISDIGAQGCDKLCSEISGMGALREVTWVVQGSDKLC